MARNATKAQVAARYKAAGIMAPKVKLDAEELRMRLAQRSTQFASAKGKDARSRKASKSRAIAMAS